MKKLSVFVFSILFLSCICYSQDTTNVLKPDFNKSGFYLQKASANFKSSVLFALSASGVLILNNQFVKTDKEYSPKTLNFVAGCFGVASIACTICAYFNIGKAGDYLRGANKNKIVLQSSKDGIGLAFKF